MWIKVNSTKDFYPESKTHAQKKGRVVKNIKINTKQQCNVEEGEKEEDAGCDDNYDYNYNGWDVDVWKWI